MRIRPSQKSDHPIIRQLYWKIKSYTRSTCILFQNQDSRIMTTPGARPVPRLRIKTTYMCVSPGREWS